MTDDKSYIIDPLTSLCKVSLLFFMPDKTKLAISHHILCVQEYTSYQWLERMKNGDNRKDISNLNAPFFKAIKWYILENPDKATLDEETTESIKTITKFAIKGLNKMKNNTYSNDISIKIIIQYLINMLTNALDGNWNEDNYVKPDNNGILSDKIKNNFDTHTINSIAKMLSDCEKIEGSQDDITVLVDCVHKLLINRDMIFVKMMKDINTNI